MRRSPVRRLGAFLLQLLLLLTWGSGAACLSIAGAGEHPGQAAHAAHDAHASHSSHMSHGSHASANGEETSGAGEAGAPHLPGSCVLMVVCSAPAVVPMGPDATLGTTLVRAAAVEHPLVAPRSVSHALEPPPPRA